VNRGRNFKLLLAAILVVGFTLRVAYFIWAPRDYAAAYSDYDDIAQNLAAGKGFSLDKTITGRSPAEPSGEVQTVPVVSRTPAYPFFLAAIYKLFGRRLRLVYLIQTVIDMLSALLFYFLTLRVASSARVALVAVFIYALYVPFISQVAVVLNETLFNFLLLVFAFVAIHAVDKPSTRSFLAAGAALGLTALCRPTTFFFPAVFLGAVLLKYRRRLGPLIVPSVAFVVGFVVLIGPWVVRNYVVLDYVGFVGSLAGEQVYGALNQWRNSDTPLPVIPEQMQARLADKSDVERNRILMREALKEILRDPLDFARSALRRTLLFWTGIGIGGASFFYFPSNRAGAETCVFASVVNIVLIAFSVLAFVRFRGAWTRYSLIPLLLLGYFYVVHLPTYGPMRYSMPVIPFLMMFASLGMVNLLGKARTAPS